ncbi:alpha/beta hydrolase [Aminobacter anthyllidis]|uniref:Alpha/beta hydrolase n=1 Tax=Aminobacter anthyllidis TaxID=1035067 RepID=A0A9X1A6C2_9HYPH|nr:alpha/beta hydrolase [Aminobacter anthyllidis]MBT1154107.1 alpha/beta hydrolase [Aminobacter anthyllidis]
MRKLTPFCTLEQLDSMKQLWLPPQALGEFLMPAQSAFKSDTARDRVLDDYHLLLARWPVSYESRFIDTDFGKAHLIASGNPTASPLVLLHGGGGNATMWIHNIAILAAKFRVYAPDVIGDVGRSTGVRPSYASGGYVRWLAQVLDGLGLEQTALAGTSFGSWLAADFALKHPERVRGLALLAPPHIEPLRLSFMLRAVLATIAPTDSRVRSFYRLVSSLHAPQPTELVMQDFVTRWRSQRQSPPPPPRISADDLRRLPPRTLFLLGQDDALYDVNKAAARIRANAPACEVALLAQAGHTLTVDRPREVSEALMEFLAEVPAPAAL